MFAVIYRLKSDIMPTTHCRHRICFSSRQASIMRHRWHWAVSWPMMFQWLELNTQFVILLERKLSVISFVDASLVVVGVILVAAVLEVFAASFGDYCVAIWLELRRTQISWVVIFHIDSGMGIWHVVAGVVLRESFFKPAGCTIVRFILLVGRVVLHVCSSIFWSLPMWWSVLTLTLLLTHSSIFLPSVLIFHLCIIFFDCYFSVLFLLLIPCFCIYGWESNVTSFRIEGKVRNNPLSFFFVPLWSLMQLI